MSFRESVDQKFCIVCKGITPSWTSNAMSQTTLHTDWGDFTVYYHKICYNESAVKEELTKMALEAKPQTEEKNDSKS